MQAAIDRMDGDPDLEDGGDEEPSLGSPTGGESQRPGARARITMASSNSDESGCYTHGHCEHETPLRRKVRAGFVLRAAERNPKPLPSPRSLGKPPRRPQDKHAEACP